MKQHHSPGEEIFEEHWLSAYLDNELSVEQRQIVEQRIAVDSTMRELLEDMQRVRGLVASLPRANAQEKSLFDLRLLTNEDRVPMEDEERSASGSISQNSLAPAPTNNSPHLLRTNNNPDRDTSRIGDDSSRADAMRSRFLGRWQVIAALAASILLVLFAGPALVNRLGDFSGLAMQSIQAPKSSASQTADQTMAPSSSDSVQANAPPKAATEGPGLEEQYGNSRNADVLRELRPGSNAMATEQKLSEASLENSPPPGPISPGYVGNEYSSKQSTLPDVKGGLLGVPGAPSPASIPSDPQRSESTLPAPTMGLAGAAGLGGGGSAENAPPSARLGAPLGKDPSTVSNLNVPTTPALPDSSQSPSTPESQLPQAGISLPRNLAAASSSDRAVIVAASPSWAANEVLDSISQIKHWIEPLSISNQPPSGALNPKNQSNNSGGLSGNDMRTSGGSPGASQSRGFGSSPPSATTEHTVALAPLPNSRPMVEWMSIVQRALAVQPVPIEREALMRSTTPGVSSTRELEESELAFKQSEGDEAGATPKASPRLAKGSTVQGDSLILFVTRAEAQTVLQAIEMESQSANVAETETPRGRAREKANGSSAWFVEPRPENGSGSQGPADSIAGSSKVILILSQTK